MGVPLALDACRSVGQVQAVPKWCVTNDSLTKFANVTKVILAVCGVTIARHPRLLLRVKRMIMIDIFWEVSPPPSHPPPPPHLNLTMWRRLLWHEDFHANYCRSLRTHAWRFHAERIARAGLVPEEREMFILHFSCFFHKWCLFKILSEIIVNRLL